MMRFSFVILTAFLLTIILTDNAFALRLNEIESNPEGEDSGFEWVELYSAESVNLDGYVLDHDGRGGAVNLSGSFSGYFVFTFQNQWLRNTNETVYLKLNGNVIDTAGPFSDNKKEKTYVFCSGAWAFDLDTMNAENDCSGGTSANTNNNQNQQNSNSNNNQNNVEEQNETQSEDENTIVSENNIVNPTNLVRDIQDQKPKKIVLNTRDPQDPKYEVTRTYKTRIGVIYFFIGFSVLLVVLIALRKL